jgi:hypothetical protein
MRAAELWWARVGRAEGALGAKVAVVVSEGPPPGSFSQLAEELGADVVAFLLPSGDGRFDRLAFAGPRRATGSALAELGAAAVLEARGGGVGGGLHWTDRRALPADSRALSAPLASVLGTAAPRGDAGRVVTHGGGRWAYARFDSPAALQLADVPKARAWAFLRHEGLDGLCLYSVGEGVQARAFTAAREGREAGATPALLLGLPLGPSGGGRARVEQGRGPARRRAAFHLELGAGGVRIGAEVVLLSRGRLLTPAGGVRKAS